jgi:hypothetical protein
VITSSYRFEQAGGYALGSVGPGLRMVNLKTAMLVHTFDGALVAHSMITSEHGGSIWFHPAAGRATNVSAHA